MLLPLAAAAVAADVKEKANLSTENKTLILLFCFCLNLDPMDYFLLDAKTGELRTARPLDREALPDATGIIILTIRVSTFG